MNHLLAKLKGKDETLWKVLSQPADFYNLPDLSVTQPYDPRHTLDEGEWHRLENYSDNDFKNSVIGVELNTANHNQIAVTDYSNILYLSCKQGDYWLFQKITPSQILKKNWFRIAEAPTLHVDQPIIVLNNYLDAIFDIENDILYFRDLGRIKPIFKGIDELYREATQQEVEGFLSGEFISLADEYTASKVKSANRKRIALIIDRLSSLTKAQQTVLLQYTASYCPDIDFKDGAFSIGTEDQLKRVLYGIEERYYTTQLGKEKRLANSVQKLEDT